MNTEINKIVELLVVERKLDKLIAPFQLTEDRANDAYLKEEFKQELCIILLTYKDPDKLIRMYERDELDYFILGIIKRQLKSVNSPFWKTHNRWESYREEYKEIDEYGN